MISIDYFKYIISPEWLEFLEDEFDKNYWNNIINKLNSSIKFYPPKEDIFKSLNLCKPSNVKVVIIGQDPYIKINQADGLAFSVNTKTNIPPSLRNITKEIARQYNINCIPKKYSLLDWEKEGVLLLNTILTVDEGKSNSHKNIGWENFTSNIINKLSVYNDDILFMAWGKQAKEVCDLNVSGNKDRIIFSGHPSPLNTSSNKFLGCGCFGIVDNILKDKNIQPINWSSIFYK